jgi:hypothetical protein
MTQADRVHSTPPLNTPIDHSRRNFLSTAAGLVAGGTALAAVNVTAMAAAEPDPIFAMIETHRAATEALNAVFREKGRLEDAGQEPDKALEDTAFEAEGDALTELIETVPSTLGGVIASMAYIIDAAERDAFRYSREELVPLLANLCEALKSVSGLEGGSHAEG